MTAPALEYVVARRVLLDALDALGEQVRCVVLVGAQAVYLRAGDGGLAVTPHTTDADLALRPELLADSPELAASLSAAGFEPESADSVGIWVTQRDIGGKQRPVQVDLLVPEAVGGPGRRAARIPPHDARAARKVPGLEGGLFDHDPMDVTALDPADTRRHRIQVAGPAALLVAKAHKILERLADTKRLMTVAKDALDVVRILRGCGEADVAERMSRLLNLDPSGGAAYAATAARTAEAVEFLRKEFGVPAGRGCDLAVEAATGAMEAEELRASTVALARQLLGRLTRGGSPSGPDVTG